MSRPALPWKPEAGRKESGPDRSVLVPHWLTGHLMVILGEPTGHPKTELLRLYWDQFWLPSWKQTSAVPTRAARGQSRRGFLPVFASRAAGLAFLPVGAVEAVGAVGAGPFPDSHPAVRVWQQGN